MLTVYKASAGSGKTFQLVVEYLKLLFKNPVNYKHILAVTFTNKATAEMKSRILEQLHLLASNQPSDYLHILQDNKYTEKEIRDKAKTVIKNILHDYNRFSINTIDSFTQRIIKSFNRELGISPNFTIELDSDMILEEAADRMLAKIDHDKKLLKWLMEFSKEKIEENYSQRIEDDIKALGKELFKEHFQIFFPEKSDSIYSRENLEDFGKELNKIKAQFENTLKEKGQAGVQLIRDNGFSVNDFLYKKTGIAGYYYSLGNGEIKDAGKRVLVASEDVEKWYTKSHKQANEIHSLVEQKLQPLLNEILTFTDSAGTTYYSAVAVLKQLRMLGILADLKEEIKLLLHEKGVLQISDSNLLLSKIIGQSDSPFIYEKTGNYFKHFMLDEFQDTSTLQWHNFKPLVINSLAEGNDNLIVGDVKQSIYRWRNSDWKILAEQINSDFSETQLNHKILEKNWRSDSNIIDFNNAIFERLKENFENHLIEELNIEDEFLRNKFSQIYSTFKQEQGKSNNKSQGLIKVNFLSENNFKDKSIELLSEQVKQLQDNGIKASDIAILIRKNSEGTAIIKHFLNEAAKAENEKYNLSVLSNESLFLYASKGVLFVIHVIELLIDPKNEIIRVALLNLWNNWLKPELQSKGQLLLNTDDQIQFDFYKNEPIQVDEHFNELFEAELSAQLEIVKQKISLSSLDETITHICSQFKIFELNSELPFIQTLIDKAGELKSSLSNDLSNLLFWWNEKGYKASVSINENVDSIRLLTVHKSKGLEYKTVLIPYLDWGTSWSGNKAPILWCTSEIEPFCKFPLLPIRAGKQMEKSHFKNVYYEEKINYLIDTLNLIYVAFTRAKSVLVINCQVPKESTKTKGKSLNQLLKNSLDTISKSDQFSECWNKDFTVFEFGKIPRYKSESTSNNSVKIVHYNFTNFGDKIKLRTSGEDFLIEGKKKESVKNSGKIIHDILSEIKTRDDIEIACASAHNKGLINEIELDEIQIKIKNSIDSLNINSWFDGSYSVLNERSLITNKKILRPDRIMISGDVAIVVDYKTGEKKSENYNLQVKRYTKTLKETGIKKVIGFLWYINQTEVEKVCEL